MFKGLAAAGAERLQLILNLLKVQILQPTVGKQDRVVRVAHRPQYGGDQAAGLLIGQCEFGDQFAQDHRESCLVKMCRRHGDERLIKLESEYGRLRLQHHRIIVLLNNVRQLRKQKYGALNRQQHRVYGALN